MSRKVILAMPIHLSYLFSRSLPVEASKKIKFRKENGRSLDNC
jgi:hypothetical protein